MLLLSSNTTRKGMALLERAVLSHGHTHIQYFIAHVKEWRCFERAVLSHRQKYLNTTSKGMAWL